MLFFLVITNTWICYKRTFLRKIFVTFLALLLFRGALAFSEAFLGFVSLFISIGWPLALHLIVALSQAKFNLRFVR